MVDVFGDGEYGFSTVGVLVRSLPILGNERGIQLQNYVASLPASEMIAGFHCKNNCTNG